MHKKILLVVIFFCLVFAPYTSAFRLAPFFNITVNENAVGGDGNFSFHIQAFDPVLYFSKDFNIQTISGAGTNFTSTVSDNASVYFVTQDPQPGWQNSGMVCISDDPSVTTTPVDNGVMINPITFSSITCNFTNIQQTAKTPVLIIPGTLGSEIDKGSDVLWPDINRIGKSITDDFMDSLQFQTNGTPLDTSLTLGKVLDAPIQDFDYTKGLVNDFITQGYATETNISLFPYDWRDDISKNADIFLKQKINDILASSTVQKLDIIAHSQGGLLIKRLLSDYPEYRNKIDKLIFVGTPNLGAPGTAKVLIYGDDFNIRKYKIFGLNSEEIKKISQNMPAVYEMLPSREYFNHSTGYAGVYDYSGFIVAGKILPTYDQTKATLKQSFYNLNSSLLDSADVFHSSAYDNFDFSGSGIQTFNIMGCESATIGKIYINGTGNKSDITYEPGDGTVPLVSASNIGGAQNFYVLKTGDLHSTMLTTDGIRQKLVDIISGSNTEPNNGTLSTNPALCVFKGKKVEVHSPVNLNIYDEAGNHVGPNLDGTFDYQIEGVKYDEIGHNKYAFLPDDGHAYTVKLTATDSGVFNFYSSQINGDQTGNVAYYNDVPVTPTSTADVILNDANNQNIQFTSDNRIVPPTSVLDSSQAQDTVSPISTSTITGLLGQPGFYHSNATITLSAIDPVIVGQESQTSGLLKTQYSLDGNATTTYSGPISVTTEGPHTVTFFSTDKAGNNELPQSITFTIDKTAPEFGVQFNPATKDFDVTASDDKDPNPVKICATTQCTATDKAGNISILKFSKLTLPLNIKNFIISNLTYNGQAVSIDPNLLTIAYTLSGSNISGLTQTELIKNQQILNILYSLKQNQSTITDLTKGTKPVISTAAGIKLLQVSTLVGKLKTVVK